ncbi:MAG: DegT/DnrJ/EryC1/StrS family aminotransferase [Actinomycetota bacterium]
MTPAIPLFAHRAVLEPLLPRVAERQRAVLESGRYVLGPELEEFEREFAAYVGRRHCVGVANGTEALTIGLRALGIEPGAEVIVPAFTFFATAEAVVNAGARPVFADVDPHTDCISAETIEGVIGPRTRAIVPVHMFGNPAPMAELSKLASSRGLTLLEDAAQAAGARLGGRAAGALGDAAGFSFYPGKPLGAFGDAGALLTDDDEVAAAARGLRDHGSAERWVHTEVGFNSRLDELQAAALRVLLPHLDQWAAARRRVASLYGEAGLGELVTLPPETPGAEPAYHLYVVRTSHRDSITQALEAAGIESRAYYTPALHQQPAMRPYARAGSLPAAERLADEGLALPMGPALDEEAVRAVTAAVAGALSR